MASPPIPPALIQLAARPFSFYPPIAGVEPNQWRLRKADWRELVVSNTRNSIEIAIPRRYVGETSQVGDPVLIVGLLRELQYLDGELRPLQRRVVEMPLAVGDNVPAHQPRRHSPAPVVGIRLEPRREHKFYKIAGGAIAASFLFFAVTSNLIRVGDAWQRIAASRHPSYPVLSYADDYAAVIHKLGKPLTDRTSVQNGREYRALSYRRFTAILSPTYLGAVDPNWKPLTGAVELKTIHSF